MYLSFYGLKEKPFGLTPDSHFLFLSEKHREAIAHLKFGLHARKGFILVTGEIGSGKTTMCRAVVSELKKTYQIALILNPLLSPSGLLQAIITDLGIECRSCTRQALIQALNEYVVGGNDVVVIIDEAQHLSAAALEQIRLLGNLETEKDKLLQLVLLGQPELRNLLAKESLKQLNQRIAVRYHIQPLSCEETKQYINHRLNIAGADNKINFLDSAVEDIYNYSGGIPRVINILCDYSLTSGYLYESRIITKEMVKQAIKEYKGIDSLKMIPA